MLNKTAVAFVMLVAAVVVLSAGPASADLIVYEGFDSSDATNGSTMDGVNIGASSIGLQNDTWQVGKSSATMLGDTTGLPSGEIDTVTWVSGSGLTFGSGSTALQTATGAVQFATGVDNGATAVIKGLHNQLDLAAPTSGSVWGSYLYHRVSRTDGGAVAGIIGTASVLSINDDDWNHSARDVEFSVQAQQQATDTEGKFTAMIDHGGNESKVPLTVHSSPSTGELTTDGGTWMVLFKLTDVGTQSTNTTWSTLQVWVLTSSQFDYFKTNGLTESALDAAATGTDNDDVFQKCLRVIEAKPNTNTPTPTNYQTVNVNDAYYLFIGIIDQSSGFGGAAADPNYTYTYQFDEFRMSAGDADDAAGFASVTPVPEPATMAFLALGGLSMLGAAVRRRRRA